MRHRILPLAVVLVSACLGFSGLFGTGGSGITPAPDADRDGLSDEFEQAILEKFAPRLLVSGQECAGMPSEFLAGSLDPLPKDANGTLYGQVFRVEPTGLKGNFIEAHFYHLWQRDCGRFGHVLDSEYVSVLLQAEEVGAPAAGWKAVFWFAAAHEGTLCDSSNGATAAALGAVEKGPDIWVSKGKHASYLTQELCRRVGCGGDRCDEMNPIPRGQVINLGEPGIPMNGAAWTDSGAWPLSSKMKPDFDDTDLSRFLGLGENEVAILNGAPPPTKALLLAGNKTIGALEVTDEKAGMALDKAGDHTTGAVDVALRKTGKYFWRSLKAVGGALGMGKDDGKPGGSDAPDEARRPTDPKQAKSPETPKN